MLSVSVCLNCLFGCPFSEQSSLRHSPPGAPPARVAKVHARAAAAHAALREPVEAAKALRRAYECEGTQARCTALAEALAALPVRPARRAGVRLGAALKPGDLDATAEAGTLELLTSLSLLTSPRWALPRLAAVVQLAALAECPAHRPRMFGSAGVMTALAAWASDDSLMRLPLPPRVAATWREALGVAYDQSSLLLPSAVGFANITRRAHASRLHPRASLSHCAYQARKLRAGLRGWPGAACGPDNSARRLRTGWPHGRLLRISGECCHGVSMRGESRTDARAR